LDAQKKHVPNWVQHFQELVFRVPPPSKPLENVLLAKNQKQYLNLKLKLLFKNQLPSGIPEAGKG
jgi:hypothetical protein